MRSLALGLITAVLLLTGCGDTLVEPLLPLEVEGVCLVFEVTTEQDSWQYVIDNWNELTAGLEEGQCMVLYVRNPKTNRWNRHEFFITPEGPGGSGG